MSNHLKFSNGLSSHVPVNQNLINHKIFSCPPERDVISFCEATTLKSVCFCRQHSHASLFSHWVWTQSVKDEAKYENVPRWRWWWWYVYFFYCVISYLNELFTHSYEFSSLQINLSACHNKAVIILRTDAKANAQFMTRGNHSGHISSMVLYEKFIRLSFISNKLNVISGAREILFIYFGLRAQWIVKSFIISYEALNLDEDVLHWKYLRWMKIWCEFVKLFSSASSIWNFQFRIFFPYIKVDWATQKFARIRTSVCDSPESCRKNECEIDKRERERQPAEQTSLISHPRFSFFPLCAFCPVCYSRVLFYSLLAKMHIFNKNKCFTVLRWRSMSLQSLRNSSCRKW